MFQIVIFDDDKKGCEQTKKILEQYAEKCGRVFEIETVSESDKLIECVTTHPNLDVVFLDIRVGENADGIDLAKKINLLSPKVAVVFLTGYIEYATDVYDARHIYFVLKEELEQRLESIFMKLDFSIAARNRGYVHLHAKGKELVVREENILFLERKGRSTVIKCKGECIEVSEKLSELEEKLNPIVFVRCHNSYIVNFMAVREFTRTEFLLRDNSIIPISRYKLDETREKFLVWSKQYI